MNDQIYQEKIVALAKAKTGAGKLADPTKSARRDNPLCGDRVVIDVRLDESGRIAEIGHQVRGCLLCQASASALASVAVGRDAAGIAMVRHDAERALGRKAEAPVRITLQRGQVIQGRRQLRRGLGFFRHLAGLIAARGNDAFGGRLGPEP